MEQVELNKVNDEHSNRINEAINQNVTDENKENNDVKNFVFIEIK